MAIQDPALMQKVLEERIAKIKAENALKLYVPYAKQGDFHAAGKTHRERLLMAGNQLGKCILAGSLIDTPTGTVKVDRLKSGNEILAWDGEAKVAARIHAPFDKAGLHVCALLVMSDGRTIGVADHHRVFFSDGWKLMRLSTISMETR